MANEIAGLGNVNLQPAQARPASPAASGERVGNGVSASVPAAADQVTLTDSARLLQRLEARIEDSPAFDQQRVALIKQQIASGAYSVDAGKVAEQLANLESELSDSGQVTKDVTRSLEYSREKSGYSLTVTSTGPYGRLTGTREISVSFDPETQTRTRDVTITGPGGESVERSMTATRTEDGFTNSLNVTRSSGETFSRQVVQAYDAESDSVTREVTRTGEHGVTLSATTQFARAEDGSLIHKTGLDVIRNRDA